ncbi:TPA: hypothetical protein SMP59_001202 [Proteus mirabilis]|nr:hypothetical protein [Proteus mirabilis]
MKNIVVKDLKTLEDIYGQPAEPSVLKEVDFIHPLYRPYIEATPFVALATYSVLLYLKRASVSSSIKISA